LVEPMLDEFQRFAGSVAYRPPVLDLVSNLTGQTVNSDTPMDASYWRRHAREPVRFAESINTLRSCGIRIFLEIGPAPVLIGMARQCVEDLDPKWLASLCEDRDDRSQMLSSLGELFVLGAKPDWIEYDRPYRRRRVALPTYPFQRERHWLPVASADSGGARLQCVNDAQKQDELESVSALISKSDSRVSATEVKGNTRRERILCIQSEPRADVVGNYLAEEISRILKVPLASVDRGKPIVSMGFDSLMSLELKNQIETDLGVSVAMSRLIQGPTILELSDFVVELLVNSRGIDTPSAVSSSMVEVEEGVL
jgi:acyl transferase domain-containing protein